MISRIPDKQKLYTVYPCYNQILMQLYRLCLYSEFLLAVPVFILLFFISAPYGKFKKSGWGPSVNARLAWFSMELPAVVLPLYFFISAGSQARIPELCFLLIWELHYLQRTVIYPALLSRGSRPVPVLIVLFSLVFNMLNGFTNGYGIYVLGDYGTSSPASPAFITGAAVFIAGFLINLSSDHILRTLRKSGERGYKIPSGGLFSFICSPNYLGEILEWTGWAILTLSPAGAAFLVFTVANLAPRARANLRWYRERFPGYPKNIKGLIPFIF